MIYHVRLEFTTDRPVTETEVDMAGGRLATRGAAISFKGTEVGVTVYGDFEHPGHALNDSEVIVDRVFSALGIELDFRSGHVYTEAEFDKKEVKGNA